jgi:hypothetical protein
MGGGGGKGKERKNPSINADNHWAPGAFPETQRGEAWGAGHPSSAVPEDQWTSRDPCLPTLQEHTSRRESPPPTLRSQETHRKLALLHPLPQTRGSALAAQVAPMERTPCLTGHPSSLWCPGVLTAPAASRVSPRARLFRAQGIGVAGRPWVGGPGGSGGGWRWRRRPEAALLAAAAALLPLLGAAGARRLRTGPRARGGGRLCVCVCVCVCV